MLDTATKKRIDDARDILVGKVPDPKSQVEQITIALIYKFMDDMDNESVEMGGKASFFTGVYAKYAWTKLFDKKLGSHEIFFLYTEALAQLPLHTGKDFPQLFRNIFKNAYLPYRDPETLKMFLKTINEFSYDHSERLGDAFEYLLSVLGSQGDAGQFRTPRNIIDFIVAVLDPKKNETICDPACGTAGFLISSYKHILEQNKKKAPGDLLKPDERKAIVKNFTGYDISPDMVRLSLVNMYLHNFSTPQITEYDTLYSIDKWNESYDIILANPPFMTPKGAGPPHAKFKIKSNRSEVLFVDYIAEHINPVTGRAGVIVPEGIIFQSGTAYKALRKMLVDNYLYAVVSLPAGVFNPYSGVKTSILLMDKAIAKKTNEILFIKIDNDGFGLGAQRREHVKNDLPDALILLQQYKEAIYKSTTAKPKLSPNALLVSRDKIGESGEYILSLDKYIANDVVYGGKWNRTEVKDLCDILSGFAFDSKKFNDSKGFPLIRIRDIKPNSTKTKYDGDVLEPYIVKNGDLLIGMDGEFNTTIWEGGDALLNQRVCKLHNFKNVSKEYIFRLIQKPLKEIEASTFAVTVKHISTKQIKQIQIPLPPLSVQQEIVNKIENWQKKNELLKKEIENNESKIKEEINILWQGDGADITPAKKRRN